MAFTIETPLSTEKSGIYTSLLPQINSLIEGENNLTANLANICAALKYSFENFLWVGFYLRDIKISGELVLGPFQGRVACTRITIGKGVCGKAAAGNETVIVSNVDEFPGHIVCDPLSKSEIVVPVSKDGFVSAVLDIDSGNYSDFDETDRKYLEMLIKNIRHIFTYE
ncbi:MAG: GAF domain-containing protein [Bacteroidetes bacterium]|nr:GAF domain-containing protein [Bacteroidota bacterium]